MNGFGMVQSANKMWKYYKMRQQGKGFFRGLLAGLAVGAAAAALTGGMMQGGKFSPKRAERAKREFGEFFGNVREMFS